MYNVIHAWNSIDTISYLIKVQSSNSSLFFQLNYLLLRCSHYAYVHAIWSLLHNDCLDKCKIEDKSVSLLMTPARLNALSRVHIDYT